VPSEPVRIESLDVFRGLAAGSMVVVNNPGNWDAIYWPLDHAEWHGWTPTDLIFPFFLFIVGVSITVSRHTLSAPWWRLARRAAVIVGLGLFMAGFPFFSPDGWRIPGVLQRIGICYLAAAFLYRWAPKQHRPLALATIAVAILIASWWMMTRFGDLSAEGNVGARLDRALFGTHLYRTAWDPEGLFTTLPALATTIAGVLAGMWLRASGSPKTKAWALAGVGAGLFAAGQVWHLALPINKQLWTSSYVLLTAGLAAVTLSAIMYVVDVRGLRGWTRPFAVLGTNAISLFVVSGLIGKLLIVLDLQWSIYERGFSWIGSPNLASLAYALTFLTLMYAMCDVMNRRGIVLKA
jgi:predicted acyltransferase